MLTALNQALGQKGSSLAAAYHDYAIAAKLMRTCGGGYVLPFCFEEASRVRGRGGLDRSSRTIGTVGGCASFRGGQLRAELGRPTDEGRTT